MPTQTLTATYTCGHTLTRTFPTTLPAGTRATVYEACQDCQHNRFYAPEGWWKCDHCPITAQDRCQTCHARVCPDCRAYHAEIAQDVDREVLSHA